MAKKNVLIIVLLLAISFVPLSNTVAKQQHFPRTYEEIAASINQLPTVLPDHPRLLIRKSSWKGGLSLAQLKERGQREPWARRVKKMKSKFAADKNVRKYPDQAALYYLLSGDEGLVPKIVTTVSNAKHRSKTGGSLMKYCMAYDWICTSPSVSGEDKKRMQNNLVALAARAAQNQEKAADMWHHYGSGGWSGDLLVVGLVLYGEHPDAGKYLSWGVGHFLSAYLPGWQFTGGGWLGGGQSYSAGPRKLTIALSCWESATKEGIFGKIRREYGNWLEELMYFMMYQILPDKSRSGALGLERTVYKHCYPDECFMMVARGYKNPDAYAFLRWKGFEPKKNILLYDEETDAIPPRFPDKLPQGKIWGRDGLGYVQMRSGGWGKDATIIEFKCGDFIWGHGYNHEHNGFYIYHKGRLVTKTGAYTKADDFWFGSHARHWYRRTVSANSMLVIDPDEFSFSSRKIDGADSEGFYSEYGGQRLNYGFTNTFTFDEYLARRKTNPSRVKDDAGMRWETGDITAFENDPDGHYSYVRGDATMAYNNPQAVYTAKGKKNIPKIDLFDRAMVFLHGKYLIVFDRVNALKAEFRKAWLLHSIDKPVFKGNIINATVPGHIEEFAPGTVEITWGKGEIPIPDADDPGRLFIKTFLPEKYSIWRIGGKGYEFWVLGKNYHPKSWPREKKKRSKHARREVAGWRLEISPVEPSKYDCFLNLLHITDTHTHDPVSSTMIRSNSGNLVGVHVDGWIIMFPKRPKFPSSMRYVAPDLRAEHLIVGLRPGGNYHVAQGKREIYVNASAEGTLRFSTETAGNVLIELN